MTLGPRSTLAAALLAVACSSGGGDGGPPPPAPVATARTYGTAGTYIWFQDLAPTPAGGYVVAAGTGADAIVFEVDAAGAIVWQHRFDSGSTDVPTSVRPVAGGFVVGGRSGSGSGRSWVMTLDAAGAILWKNSYAPLGRTSVGSPERRVLVRPTADGGYVLGTTDERYYSANYWPRAWVAKLDGSGAVTWQISYGDLWIIDGGLQAIEPTSDGGYVLAGFDQGELLVAKIGPDGALLWSRWFGDVFGGANAVHEVPGVGYVVAGYRQDAATSITQPVLLALDASGALRWERIYGGAESAFAEDVAPDVDGGYLVAGSATLGSTHWLLGMKVSAAGDIVWQRTYGKGSDFGAYAARTADGRWRIAGTGGSGATFGVWVLELPPDGAVTFPGTTLVTGSAGLARVQDVLAEPAHAIAAIATTYSIGASTFTVSPGELAAVQDAP